jgi:hypothetical protein
MKKKKSGKMKEKKKRTGSVLFRIFRYLAYQATVYFVTDSLGVDRTTDDIVCISNCVNENYSI